MDEEVYIGGRRGAPIQLFCSVFVIALCLTMTVVMGCRRVQGSAETVLVHQQLTPQPVRVGSSVIAIQLADTSNKPLSHAAIKVEADMSHPGMAPLFSEAKETAPGSYQAPVDFNMEGDWVVLLHIKLTNGRKVEQRMDIGGVLSR